MPNQHGAWPMLLVPYGVGTALGVADLGFRWTSVPLFGCWFVGYLAYFAATLWLKSRRKPRYVRPLLTYSAVAAACAVGVVVLDPPLALWAPPFLPLLGLGLWAAAHRSERSVLAGGAMVAAACLMTLVAYDACRPPGTAPGVVLGLGGLFPGAAGAQDVAGAGDADVVLAAAVLLAYFFGTVLYVKTMIRERGRHAYVVASVGHHAVVTVACAWLALGVDARWWWAAGVFALLTARAWALPGHAVTPRAIGIGEIVATLAVTAVAVAL